MSPERKKKVERHVREEARAWFWGAVIAVILALVFTWG